MQKLIFHGNLLLKRVNLWDPEVTELREKVRNALIQGIISLRAYAAKYEKYLELHNMKVESLLK